MASSLSARITDHLSSLSGAKVVYWTVMLFVAAAIINFLSGAFTSFEFAAITLLGGIYWNTKPKDIRLTFRN